MFLSASQEHRQGGDIQVVLGQPADECTTDGAGEDLEWDVCRGAIKRTALERMSMLPPALVHAVGNVLGGTVAASGYAVGKFGSAVGAGKAVDSTPFKTGARAWMYANGIFPKVVYEPWGSSNASGHPEKNPGLTPVLVANHTTYLDGLVLAVEFGAPRIVATSGSQGAPILGDLMREMDVIFVDRSSDNSRQHTLDAIGEHCREWTPGSRPLLIFPEGKTTNGESLLPFKKGAFMAGLPVRPVIMVYTGQWDPACCTYRETASGEKIEVSAKEWGKQFVGHLVHSVHVRVLAPYVPSAAECADPQLYADNVQAHMSRALIRVREELRTNSWKEAARRQSGGLGYKPGDGMRCMAQRAVADGRSWRGRRRSSAPTPF